MANICQNQQVGSEFLKLKFKYGIRVSKTRDANLQTSFLPVLTYYILSSYCTSLQISPRGNKVRASCLIENDGYFGL